MSDPSPPPRPFARGPVRAQTASEAAAFDRRAIQDVGVPEPVLMENAGRSAALVSRAVFQPDGVVVALVGSGNNGGDALVAARSFVAWGHRVRVVLVSDRPADDPLLHGWSLDLIRDQEISEGELEGILTSADLVVDGILGTGVQGAPRERQARIIDGLNAADGPKVVALDVPSGADASTGAVPGAVVRADLTVSFGAPKIGALLHPARSWVGRHVTVEIGFPPMDDDHASALVATPEWARTRLPRRDTDTHKNRVGRVVVVGGGAGMAGAAILGAQAAFRAGAGLVQVASVRENREAIHAALPEAIFVEASDDEALTAALEVADAVAVGPGLGTHAEAAGVLRRVAEVGSAPLVLDADALNLSAGGAIDVAEVAADRDVLMTPHPGEMSRLMDVEGEASSRPEIARAASRRFGSTLLLKGAPSLVASPDGALAVDTQSSSDLAVAGMGDTLTGVCVSLLAQGAAAATAASLGLYLTGRAAALAARGAGLTPSDVAQRLPDAVAELGPGPGPATSTDLDLPFVAFDADPAR